jgi:hypothetical protein
VVGVLGVAGPLLRDAHATDHPHAPVGDEDLAVVAVGKALERVGLGGTEARDRRARLLDRAQQAGLHLRGADGVEQDVDLDA